MAKYGIDLQLQRLRGTAGPASPLHDAGYLLLGAKRLFDLASGVSAGSYPTPALTRVLSDASLHRLRERITFLRDTNEHWVDYGQHIGKRQTKLSEAPGSLTVAMSADDPDIPITYLSTTVTTNEIDEWSSRAWKAAQLDLSS